MLRNNGEYLIYYIQHEQDDGKWVGSNLDVFGYPPGFCSTDECWQKTNIHGTFNAKVAYDGLKSLRSKHPKTNFRLVIVSISQSMTVVDQKL